MQACYDLIKEIRERHASRLRRVNPDRWRANNSHFVLKLFYVLLLGLS